MNRQRIANEVALGLLVVLIIALAFSIARSRRQIVRATAGGLRVELLDVGQGDAILIRSPEGKVALIDAGPSRDEVARLLEARGIRSIDLAVVSHHHADHYGGMAEVIRRFRPRAFLDADSAIASSAYARLLALVRDSGMTAIRADPDRPRKIMLGTVALTVLPQPPPDAKLENNNSVGIRLEYGNFAMLLTGDSQGSERRWWARQCPELCRDVQVLKLAHHGSRNGLDRRWLELARPRLAVASLGRGNDYGHPHPQTLNLLAADDVPLLRTDLDGSILVRADGQTWSYEPGSTAASTARGR